MAERVFPYKGTSENRLAAQMSEQSGLNLIHGVDFFFGNVYREPGPEGRNTLIRVLPTDPERGPSWHRYHRRSIGLLANLIGTARLDPLVMEGQPDTDYSIHDILATINEQFGLDLVGEEVSNESFRTPSDESAFMLRIKIANSVAWLPNSIYEFEAYCYPAAPVGP